MKQKIVSIAILLAMAFASIPVQADDPPPVNQDSPPVADISVVKSVSGDGGATWDDAQLAPGLAVAQATELRFLIQIYNSGDFALTGITLTDTLLDTSACVLPATMQPGQLAECVVGPFIGPAGQTVNTVLVTAQYGGETLTATDSAYVFVGDVAALSIEKLAGLGGAWYSADNAPGLGVPASGKLRFRIVVTNEGTRTFTNILLTDTMLPLTGCEIPAELPPGLSFQCTTDKIELAEGAQVNTATVTAIADGEPHTASDSAHFLRAQNVGGEIIIIEGPCESIDGNIIVIGGHTIVFKPNDPILAVIRIGDVIRVEGTPGDGDILIAVVVIVVDVDIFVDNDNQTVFRDDGECGNPPPPWAPAWGWRRKCQGALVTLGALPPGLRDKKDKHKKNH